MAQERGLYAASQATHLDLSRAAILATAEAALERTPLWRPRNALVLGAGNCADIPVSDLVDAFNRTIFVDIYPEGTERALSDLRPSQLAKIDVIGADVTGVMGDLLTMVDELAAASGNYQTFAPAAAAAFQLYTPNLGRKPRLGRDYAFVCSQLLLSQLCGVPYDHIGSRVAANFGRQLPELHERSNDPLGEAMHKFRLDTQTDHINHLAYLVGSTGAVHFVDTYAKITQTDRAPVSTPMVSEATIRRVIAENFDMIRPPQEWIGQLTPQMVFRVVANSLVPKP